LITHAAATAADYAYAVIRATMPDATIIDAATFFAMLIPVAATPLLFTLPCLPPLITLFDADAPFISLLRRCCCHASAVDAR